MTVSTPVRIVGIDPNVSSGSSTGTVLAVGSDITTPTVYIVTVTLANTEYSQAMPADCKYFEFHCRTATDIRFAFVIGHVAAPTSPYMTLPAANWYFSPQVNQGAAPSTLYVASATAGVVVEVVAWT